MKISTAQCEAICSSLLTGKSLDQILLNPYKFTYSDRPPSVITLNWLPRGKVPDFLCSTSQSLSCYGSQEDWCIAFVLVLIVLNLLLSCFHYCIPISPSRSSHCSVLCAVTLITELVSFFSYFWKRAGWDAPTFSCLYLSIDTGWECFLLGDDPKTIDDIDYSE